MRYPARDWHICPCCGTEFNFDDVCRTYEEIRRDWIANGASWWSQDERQPDNWDPVAQLNNLERLKATSSQ
jgi:hypothetical protein